MVNSVENFQQQVDALRAFFKAFPLAAHLLKHNKICLHSLDPDETVPEISFPEEEVGFARAMFSAGFWDQQPFAAADPYIRYSQRVMGVRLSIRIKVCDENLNRLEAAR